MSKTTMYIQKYTRSHTDLDFALENGGGIYFPMPSIQRLLLHNAHDIYNHIHPADKIDHHDSRIIGAETLVKCHGPRVLLGGPTAPAPPAVQYDGINHYLVACKQGRCVICWKNTRIMCEKCEKRLHKTACYEKFCTK